MIRVRTIAGFPIARFLYGTTEPSGDAGSGKCHEPSSPRIETRQKTGRPVSASTPSSPE